MNELKPRTHDEDTGIDYILVGDYYIPAIELPGKLHTYLADLNEQAQDRYRLIVRQMMEGEGVTEDLKRRSQWEWVKAMSSISSLAEEIIMREMIYS